MPLSLVLMPFLDRCARLRRAMWSGHMPFHFAATLLSLLSTRIWDEDWYYYKDFEIEI